MTTRKNLGRGNDESAQRTNSGRCTHEKRADDVAGPTGAYANLEIVGAECAGIEGRDSV